MFKTHAKSKTAHISELSNCFKSAKVLNVHCITYKHGNFSASVSSTKSENCDETCSDHISEFCAMFTNL